MISSLGSRFRLLGHEFMINFVGEKMFTATSIAIYPERVLSLHLTDASLLHWITPKATISEAAMEEIIEWYKGSTFIAGTFTQELQNKLRSMLEEEK